MTIWTKIKEKLHDLWQLIKAFFIGMKWMSKEQYEELAQDLMKNRYSLWDKMDTDKDGWITTKDIIDWFKKKETVKEGE